MVRDWFVNATTPQRYQFEQGDARTHASHVRVNYIVRVCLHHCVSRVRASPPPPPRRLRRRRRLSFLLFCVPGWKCWCRYGSPNAERDCLYINVRVFFSLLFFFFSCVFFSLFVFFYSICSVRSCLFSRFLFIFK